MASATRKRRAVIKMKLKKQGKSRKRAKRAEELKNREAKVDVL
jgi:hypothetical protein